MSDLHCKEFVELVTDFLDRALDPETEQRLVDHLALCDGCERYLHQVRQTIRTLGGLSSDDLESLPAEIRGALLAAFHNSPR